VARKPPKSLDPLVEVWPTGQPLYRVHQIAYPPAAPFASDRPARFRPLYDQSGDIVPMLYGTGSPEATVAESVLHDLAPRRPRAVAWESLGPFGLSEIVPRRALRLAQLHSAGLLRLRLRNTDLIDTLPSRYPDTLPWGQALYDLPERLDGIVWMSRRYNSVRACVLFGSTGTDTRVETADLALGARSFATLAFGDGYELVVSVCTAADVLITRP
jgi:hypothetical protein